LSSPKLSENANLWDELKRLVDGTNHQLAVFDIDNLHLLIKKLPCPSNQPRYVKLEKSTAATLKDALRGMTVIEYPTIEVVQTKDLDKYPRMIQEVDETIKL
jgi:hypothetical protein